MIAVTGGGTGGHFFPALITYSQIKSSGKNALLITDQRCARYARGVKDAKIVNLRVRYKTPLKIMTSCFAMVRVFLQMLVFFIQSKTSSLISFGGYSSVPIVLAARLLGIKVILHEQNIPPGKANIVLSHIASKVAVSYKKSASYFSERVQSKIIHTGPIMRYQKQKKGSRNFNSKILTILVLGGSQGALILSKIVPSAMDILLQQNPKMRIKIIQQARKSDVENLKEFYKKHRIDNIVAPFFDNLDEIYKKSDIIICRSGASTIAETIAAGLPQIFIPLPTAAQDHQTINAQYVVEQAGAALLPQKKDTASKLAAALLKWESDRDCLQKISDKLLKMSDNGLAVLIEKSNI